MVTGRNKAAIEDYFDRTPSSRRRWRRRATPTGWPPCTPPPSSPRSTSSGRARPRGLGHAVLQAAAFVGDEPFAVLLGDDLIDARDHLLEHMLAVQAEHGGSVVALLDVGPENIDKYGAVAVEPGAHPAIDGDEVVTITGLVEKPPVDEAPSSLAIIGRYVLAPEVFEVLRETAPGRGGEIQLTDALATLVERGEPVHGVVFSGRRYDTGDRLDYLKAVVRLASERDDLGPPFARVAARVRRRAARRGRVAVLTGRRRGTIGRTSGPERGRRRRTGRCRQTADGRQATVVRMSDDSDGRPAAGTGTPPRWTCGARPAPAPRRPVTRPEPAAHPSLPDAARRRRRPPRPGAASGALGADAHGGAAPRRDPRRRAAAGPDRARRPGRPGPALRRGRRQRSARCPPSTRPRSTATPPGPRTSPAPPPSAPVELAVVGESVAGASAPSSIGPGLALKVAAGAMLPAGADVVVPAVWTDQGAVRVAVHAGAAGRQLRAPHRGRRRARRPRRPGRHADRPGPDQPARRGRPGAGAGAARGRGSPSSAPAPSWSTSAPTPAPGQVVDVNSYALAAAARDAGAEAYRSGILPIDQRRLTEVLESQLLRSDLVLIAGTFASGGFDMVQEALAELGTMRFRPGDDAPRARRRASAGWAATTSRSSASPASRWRRWSPSRCSSARRSG